MERYRKKIEKWLPHIVGLLLFLILPLFVFDSYNEHAKFWLFSYYHQLLFMIVAFYVNYLFITPRFFYLRKKLTFFVIISVFAILLLIISQYIYSILDLDTLRPDYPGVKPARPVSRFGLHPKLFDSLILIILVLGFSSGISIVNRLRKNEAKQKEIEKAHLDSELAFLKNQISPHFFFNALNNIYGLIAIDQDKAQITVEKLSGLMRYLIYDTNIKTVELQKEFDFTLKYIELMQQRLSSKIKLEINISTQNPDAQIPPLLFIPFVENAFKHGISYRENSFVSILLKTENDKVIFECKNSIPTTNGEKDDSGGFGISNIKKRLALIYGNSFKLNISDVDNIYQIRLVVPLNKDTDE